MAINQFTEPQTVEPVIIDDWQNNVTKLNSQDIGLAEITLSIYTDGSTAPSITVGSVFENNSAYFRVETLAETPSNWSSFSNDTQLYIKYDESANSFVYTDTAPSWSDSKQGYYDSNDRYFFSVYKDVSGDYTLIGNIAQRSIDNSYELNPTNVNVRNNLDVDQTATIKDIFQEDAGDTDRLTGPSTEDIIFDAISPTIPEVGQQCALMGSFMDADGSGKYIYITNKAERTSTTVITLYYTVANFTTGGSLSNFAPGTKTVTDGSSTFFTDEWNLTTGNRIP